jgi:hypothetical protein
MLRPPFQGLSDGDYRIEELFDIIVEYPSTVPALEDLKRCLDQTDNRMALVTSLRAANTKRLLHPGVDTKDILEQYVSTIRCLRVIDPQGVGRSFFAGRADSFAGPAHAGRRKCSQLPQVRDRSVGDDARAYITAEHEKTPSAAS